jgi:hypothetical protein
VTFNYDGTTTLTISPPTVIATDAAPPVGSPGADGIVGNPKNTGGLLVGGQGSAIYGVNKDGSGTTGFASPVAAFHLSVPTVNTLLASAIPGGLARFAINAGGSLGAGTTISLSGSTSVVTTVIDTPSNGFFYTNAGSGGTGDFGTLTFNTGNVETAISAITTSFLSSVPAAHGGVYDPFSNNILLFGSNHITQFSLGFVQLADIVLTGQFDQGTVDGLGHVYVANNTTGNLTFIDYSTATGGLIDGAGNFVDSAHHLGANLDDVAPLIGAGTTTTVPEPGSLALLMTGLMAVGFSRRQKRSSM